MGSDLSLLDTAWLERWCGGQVEELTSSQAFEVAAKLKNLAVWWLRPEVLRQAIVHARHLGLEEAASQWEQSPQLPTHRGACWIAVVNSYPRKLGLLRPALALPLCWRSEPAHDTRLPANLLTLADEVRGILENIDEVTGSWSLHPSDALLEGVDLRRLEGCWDSAWAPLAGGLLLAAWEGEPDPKLWASGAWTSPQGIQRVEDLEAKLLLAESFGAQWFFVPQPKVQALRIWAQQQGLTLQVGELGTDTTDPREALGEYLAQHDLPVGPGPHLRAKRAEHFQRIHDVQIAQRFYRQRILPDVVEKLCQDLSLAALTGKALVTLVSKGFSLIPLAVQAIRPSRCLLFHDAELSEAAAQQKAGIEQETPNCQVVIRLVAGNSHEELLAAFRPQIQEFVGQTQPENLVFDLTAGRRMLNLALYDSAPPGSHVICVHTDFDQDSRRPRPCSERIYTWRVGFEASVPPQRE